METPEKLPRYKLTAHTMIKYAWDNPTAKDRRLMLYVNGHSRKINISEVGILQPFKFLVSPGFPFAICSCF
jgi:vacuolar protein sorting-associated protein 13A/C